MLVSHDSSQRQRVVAATAPSAPSEGSDSTVSRQAIGTRPAAPPRPIPAARLVATIDVGVVLGAFFAVVAGLNVDRMPEGIEAFLAIRVTLKNVLVLGVLAVGTIVVFGRTGLYDGHRLRRWAEEMRRLVVGTALVTVLATVVPLTSRSGVVEYWSLLAFWAVTLAALIVTRSTRRSLASSAHERRRVIIVGTGPQAMRTYRQLCADTLPAYCVVGFVDTTTVASSAFIRRRTLGHLAQLEELLVREHVDEVHIGLPVKSHYRQIQDTIRTCERLGVKAQYYADIFETALARPRFNRAPDAAPRVQLHMAPDGGRLVVKRLVDVCGAAFALALFSPVMLAAAIAIKSSSDGPVFYSQERYGLNRRRFRMYKLRTMVREADVLQASLESRNEASGPVFKIANDPRVTAVGKLLRRTSIDELPQLFNVLRGDMSLVGPRPLPLRDVARFTRTADLRRLSVRPGVTCLWQVSGRSALGFDDLVKLDLQYIDRWSLFLDFLIMARTIPAVLRGTGAH